MRQICFLSMDSMDGYVADDDLAIEPLRELGWEVRTLSWRQTEVAWDDFEAVVLRTTWDYQQFPDEFLRVMEQIDRSIARLENPLDIVRWNFDKRYLREMDGRDALIVPTIWDASYSRGEFGRWMTELSCDELIIKPTVSATAGHTYRLREYDEQLESVFADRSFMVQPFMPNIVAEGEYSLFYFNGEYSHAINKSPKDADFRVQEEHGGIITPVEPDERLLRVARETLVNEVAELSDGPCVAAAGRRMWPATDFHLLSEPCGSCCTCLNFPLPRQSPPGARASASPRRSMFSLAARH